MPTIEELQGDTGFMSATPADQIKYLNDTDPAFKAAHSDDQAAFLTHLTKHPTGAEPYKPAKSVGEALDIAGERYEKGTGVGAALGRLATMPVSMARSAYHAVADEPKGEEEQAAESAMSAATPLGQVGGRAGLAAKRLLLDPSIAATEHINEMARAQEAKYKAAGKEVPLGGKIAEYAGKGMAAIPMVGPYGLQLGERAGKGDVSGALTEAAGMALAPELAKEAMPGGALPGSAAEGARVFPAADVVVRGAGKAYEATHKALPTAGAVVGGTAGAASGSPAAAAYGTYMGGRVGKILQRALPEKVGATEFKLTPEEVNVQRLEGELKKATESAKPAEDAYKTYEAGRKQGIPAPDDILKAHEKAQAHLQLITDHLQAARDAAEAAKSTAPEVPDQPLALSEEQQAAQAARVPKEPQAPAEQAPINVKTPGQVQPETFPQEPTEAPRVDETTRTRPLAGDKGTLLGRKPYQLTEGVPETAASPEAPKTPLGEILPPEKPAKPGRLGTLKVSEGGKVVDTEPELQQKIEEGLQGTAKPVATAPRSFEEVLPKHEEVAEEPVKEEEAKSEPKKFEEILPKHEELTEPHEKEFKAEGISPEDLSKVDKTVSELPNQDLQRLGTRFGLDESKYDFTKREALYEGGSKHPVERIKFSKDAQEKLPEALKTHISQAADAWDKNNPQTFDAPSRSSKFWSDRAREIVKDAMTRYQDELAAKGQAGGAPDVHADAVKEGGGVYKGVQEGVPEAKLKGLVLFDHPETGSTLALSEDKVTPDAVKAKLEAHKEAWDKAKKAQEDLKATEKPEPKGVYKPGEAESDVEMARRGVEPPEKAKPYKDMTPKEQEALAAKGVSGGAPGAATAKAKELPTDDDLIKEFGESSGDPADTTFILKDGRGVANTGVEHDQMLGGRTSDQHPARERFVAEGNIRVRPSKGAGSRETSLSIPEQGVTAEQMDYLKKMSPQMRSGAVLIEVGKPGGAYRVLEYGKATDEALENAINEITGKKSAKDLEFNPETFRTQSGEGTELKPLGKKRSPLGKATK